MKQLTQQLKSGRMEILEVPFPVLSPGQVLVRNYYSVISAGTEGKTVTDARKGYISKARSRQKEVKQVLEMIKSEGFKKTYDLVMNKLEAPASLGYSCAGEVIAVGEDIRDMKVGDKVACGGSGAVHADIVAINRNLCVKVPEYVDLRFAAFSTIASIAIQGIRQADLRFGENCTVIGLGLIGLLTVEILEAAGIKAIAIDINDFNVQRARECGAGMAFNRNQEGIVQTIIDSTNGAGTDAVIITAATSSLDPVEFAGEICRKKGRVIVVGAVPTGFSRNNYYKKELELKMSSSYGPGRYDPDYEEKGIDYPIGYVRFTENRNMETFVSLLAGGKVNLNNVISHIFDFENASEAYDLVVSRAEPVTGILLKYDTNHTVESTIRLSEHVSQPNPLNVGFIGAGNFAQNAVLPRIKGKCNFIGVLTAEGNVSRYVADKYGFKYCADRPEQLLTDESIGTVFILTRHNTHAGYSIQSLKAGKNVIVEKPLAMNYDELNQVKKAYEESGKNLMLGFNRRFSPLTEKIMATLSKEQKVSIQIRINSGAIPADHWVHDPKTGGGRIIGEVCHFIDLATFIARNRVKYVSAFTMAGNPALNDTLTINLAFGNGSVANISYFSNGNKNVSKERIEVYSNNTVYLVDDFKCLTIYSDKGTKKIKLKSQDKGHMKQFDVVLQALATGNQFPVSFDDIYHSSLVTLETIRSIKENRTIEI